MEILLNIIYSIIGTIGIIVFVSWINSIDKDNDNTQSENNWQEVGFDKLDDIYKAIASADVSDSDYWLGK